MADQAAGWRTGRPADSGYYLGAWQRGFPPAWTVSELWFNPSGPGTGWWATRGYLHDRNGSAVPVEVEAWMPVPAYPGDGTAEHPRGNYWFASHHQDGDGKFPAGCPWRAFIQLPGMVDHLDTWFSSQEDCEVFIRDDILGAPLEDD
jgi:hypothetical protein